MQRQIPRYRFFEFLNFCSRVCGFKMVLNTTTLEVIHRSWYNFINKMIEVAKRVDKGALDSLA